MQPFQGRRHNRIFSQGMPQKARPTLGFVLAPRWGALPPSWGLPEATCSAGGVFTLNLRSAAASCSTPKDVPMEQ